MDTPACPPITQIVQLLRGEITGEPAAQLVMHLEGCARCIDSLQSVQDDVDHFQSGFTRLGSVQPAVASNDLNIAGNITDSNLSERDKLSFLAPAVSADELGWLDHYRVLKVLGEGGMGVVLEAEDTLLERPVALKVIKPEYRDELPVQERFLREARAMAKVKSDHVITIHQVGEHNGVAFIAMELLEGAPLNTVIESDILPTLHETVRIGREVAQALAAAHSRGLIHRDIKPENVWLEHPAGRVKLLDFGLARPQQSIQKLTLSGMIIGSPLYMSPEQARAAEVDERSDLFSLGCLLYALISGQPPFGRDTLMDTLLALAIETPAPINQCNPDCPAALADLITHLLAKDPAERLASAEQVIEQLNAVEAALESGSSGSRALTPSAWLRATAVSPAPSARVSQMTALQRSNIRKSERRQVTVLVCGCELFESQEYLENIDVEEQTRILNTFEQMFRQEVLHANGTTVPCNEDSLIACFGYPVAHEDAAQLASSAALFIQEGLTDLAHEIQRHHNLQLDPWLTVHTGLAIVGIEGESVSLVGEARMVALRLKDIASPGQILLSESTHNVLRGKFNCLSLGRHKIKGLERPIELFQLQDQIETQEELTTSIEIELTPLTGRDLEMNLLKDRWELAQEGMGQVVLLVGEAGLGKSRLVHSMKEYVGTNAVASGNGSKSIGARYSSVVEWRCSPHFRNTGLHPAASFFQRLLRFRRDEAPSVQLERLVKHVDEIGLAASEVVPLFASLLSLQADSQYPSLALTPAREREEMFRALADWLKAYSAKQPVLFVIEDLHWLDASTLEFLAQYLAESAPDRVLTLLTFRPDFSPPWTAAAHQTRLALNRLTKRQVRELIEKKTSGKVSDSVVGEVFDRSGGVPLFVEEFTKMVSESGMLTQIADNGKQIKSLMARVIPATLQDLIMARLDRMEGDRELAQLVAALGGEFSYELVKAVSDLDEPTLASELGKFVQAEILFQKGRVPNSTYYFKHALLEDALYNAMVKSHRQQCHDRIAQTLVSQFPLTVQVQPEVVAHHFSEAGLTEKSIEYWLLAGLRSQEQFANVEAISHFNRGLEAVRSLPQSPARDKQELSLLTPLGSAYQIVKGYSAPEVGPTFARAREICEAIGDSAQLFEIMWGNWTSHLVSGDLDLCMQLADEMVALAHDFRDNAVSMEAYVAPAVTLFYRGDFLGCRTHCEKAIFEYEDLDQCAIWSGKLGQNSAVVLRCYLSLSLWHLGFPDQAVGVSNLTLRLARQIAHPFSLAHALYFASWLYLNCRQPDALRDTALEETAVATDQGFALWQATANFHIGAAMLMRDDDLTTALQCVESGVQAFRALAANLTLPAQLSILAEGNIKAKRLKEAEAILDEGLSRAEKHYDRSFQAELLRLKGTLVLAVSNDQAAAERYFQEAIRIAREQNSKAWELRATTDLARLWQRQNKSEQAGAVLRTICGAYSEGETTADLQEAKALMSLG